MKSYRRTWCLSTARAICSGPRIDHGVLLDETRYRRVGGGGMIRSSSRPRPRAQAAASSNSACPTRRFKYVISWSRSSIRITRHPARRRSRCRRTRSAPRVCEVTPKRSPRFVSVFSPIILSRRGSPEWLAKTSLQLGRAPCDITASEQAST